MSDNQDQEQDRSPRFSRALMGRMAAVGLFVALGSFAVFQMMTGDAPEEQTKLEGDTQQTAGEQGTAERETAGLLNKATLNPASASNSSKVTPPASSLAKSDFENSFSKPPVNSFTGSTSPAKATNSFAKSPPIIKTAKPASQPPVLTTTKPVTKPKSPPARFAQLPDKGPLSGNQSEFSTRPPKNQNAALNAFGKAANDPKGTAQKLGNEISNSANALLEDAKKEAKTTNNLVNSIPPLRQPKSSPPPSSKSFGGGFAPPGLPNEAAQATQSKTTQVAPKITAPAPANAAFGSPSGTNSTAKQDFGSSDFGGGMNQIKPQNAPPPNRSPVLTSKDRPSNSAKALGALATGAAIGGALNAIPKTNLPPSPSMQSQPPPRNNDQNFPSPNNSPGARRSNPSQPAASTMAPQNRVSQPSPMQSRSTVPAFQASSQKQLPSNPTINRGNAAGSSLLSTPQSMTAQNPRTKNVPGDRQLEGVQAPALTVEKLSPREIQVNQSAEFEIVVRNVGRVTAEDVNVHDQIPAGTEFQGSAPQPSKFSQDRTINWNIGSLRPGQEKRIKMQLTPTRPGEIGSVAHVTFATQASMRTLVTKPVLEISHRTNPKVLIGDNVIFDVVVQNKGDGAARNVVIQEDVPRQLEFQDGYRELEYEIGTLLPGQSKQIRLGLKAAEVGRLQNVIFASAAGDLRVQHQLDMEIVAPKLITQSQGPTRRYLNREVTHQFAVENQGTAAATNVDLIAHLPAGLRFVNADNRGRYDTATHAIYWSLAELGLDVDATVSVTCMPVDAGNQDIKFEAAADLNQKSTTIQKLSVEHLVDVFFTIDDLVDPIEVGTNTSYRIRVVNQGTATATNVKLQVDFPMGLVPLSVEGNLQNQIQGQSISFAPINTLNPGDEMSLIIHGNGQVAGDHRVVVNLQADGRNAPVSKEETTHVYSDR